MRAPWLGLLLIFWLMTPAAADSSLRIAVLGDSLAAGYGLAADQSFPAQLERALVRQGYPVEVLNAGVSGDTTAGGLARLDWLLADEPDLVIVELGGNDALRALAPGMVRDNLAAILRRLEERGILPLLAGMRAPRNLGPDYYTKFDAVYPELARQFGVPLYPFFLAGVAGNPQLNLGDGIHPNAAGVALIVANILPLVEECLARLTESRGDARGAEGRPRHQVSLPSHQAATLPGAGLLPGPGLRTAPEPVPG